MTDTAGGNAADRLRHLHQQMTPAPLPWLARHSRKYEEGRISVAAGAIEHTIAVFDGRSWMGADELAEPVVALVNAMPALADALEAARKVIADADDESLCAYDHEEYPQMIVSQPLIESLDAALAVAADALNPKEPKP